MIKPVKLAKANLTMETGTIVSWLKKEGDFIQQDEILLELETDKATIEVPSFYTGYIKKIAVPEGQEVPVETIIAYVGDKDDVWKEPGPAPDEKIIEVKSADNIFSRKEVKPQRVNASPLAKRLAKELGVDLQAVKGTGPGGRIGKEDVERTAEEEKQTGKKVSLTGIKQKVALRMKESYLSAPHIHLQISINMTRAAAYRKQQNDRTEADHITFSDIFLKAAAVTLLKYPLFNAVMKNDEIILNDDINIGLAAATGEGLIVPVVKNLQEKTVAAIAAERTALIERVRKGEQTPEDVGGGTFTITNLGMFGVEAFDPILFPGQAAILGIGALQDVPAVDNGAVEIVPKVQVTLGCDHRIVDGAEAAEFLAEFKSVLEQADFQ